VTKTGLNGVIDSNFRDLVDGLEDGKVSLLEIHIPMLDAISLTFPSQATAT
jgi:hypothetical protein